MEMAVRSMETVDTAMKTDRDGSGGTSLSWQGAGIETSIPQNLSLTAVALRNCSGKNADCFRVIHRKALYRRRDVVRSELGWSHHRWARPGAGPGPLMVRLPSGPPPALFRSSSFVRKKIGIWVFVSSNSENISCVAFLKHKTAENRELALWHLVNRLVPEIA
jgi:hypothetical protein